MKSHNDQLKKPEASEYLVLNDEIDSRSINNRKNSKQDTTDHSHQKHGQIGHHEVDSQHDDNQRCQQEQSATDTFISILSNKMKERYVV